MLEDADYDVLLMALDGLCERGISQEFRGSWEDVARKSRAFWEAVRAIRIKLIRMRTEQAMRQGPKAAGD